MILHFSWRDKASLLRFLLPDSDSEGDEAQEPWYEEPKEALILLFVGGLAAASSILMRSAKR